jgi:N-acetylglucosamine kinase-like BadF-type ATPase
MTGDLAAVLAVDGGNSKTDLALVAGDGTLLAAVRGPGVRSADDLGPWLEALAGLIGRAQQDAGGEGRLAARHISACVANADLPEEEERLAAALRALGWSETTTVANDTFAVLRAGLDPATQPGPPHWGAAVTCGAGINCVAVDPSGRTTGYLALGGITGDWGGGYGLGQQALWWAVRAEDGRGPQTALREAVAAHFGEPTVRDVAIGIHLGKISEQSLLELAPVLMAVADEGDEVARNVVRRQAEEISVMALTAMRRLGLTELPTPVVLGGGVLTARDPLLISEITERITAAAPQAAVIIAAVPPVVGAALLGLDHVGAGADAERRLRASYDGRGEAMRLSLNLWQFPGDAAGAGPDTASRHAQRRGPASHGAHLRASGATKRSPREGGRQ